MKTHDELNRLIAERVLQEPLQPPCGYYHNTDDATFEDGIWYGWCYTCGKSIDEVAPEPRRYCTDPAAWGALLVWLKEQGKRVSIEGNILKDDWFATVGTHGKTDMLPGAALVLATLAAYGVEVE